MKTKIFIVMAIVLLLGGNLYAGDLTVTGKLGIGTTSPSDILHLKSGAPYLIYERTGSYARAYSFGFYFDSFSIFDVTANWKERFLIDSNGYTGIGTGSPQAQLHVAGYAIASGYYTPSDIRAKENIQPLENSLDNVLKLHGVKYDWKANASKDRQTDAAKQIGLIAQDVEKVFPELVHTDKEGYKSVSYEKLTAVLIEAVREQQKKIKELEDRISSLGK